MTTVTDANVHNIAVKGSFDDCQVLALFVYCCQMVRFTFVKDIVKALFADRTFNDTHSLGAVNSINWARILSQTVYYFYSFFRFREQFPSYTDFSFTQLQYVVPTGNFGDILAGYYAKRMGLPMAKLVVATNSNDILTRFWKSGRYEKMDSTDTSSVSYHKWMDGSGNLIIKQEAPVGGVKETLSPAMDIVVSSNFERLLWYLAYETSARSGGEEHRKHQASKTVDGWMREMKLDGRVNVPVTVLELARRDFVAERVSDDLVSYLIYRFFATTT
jgi:threonine synthase